MTVVRVAAVAASVIVMIVVRVAAVAASAVVMIAAPVARGRIARRGRRAALVARASTTIAAVARTTIATAR